MKPPVDAPASSARRPSTVSPCGTKASSAPGELVAAARDVVGVAVVLGDDDRRRWSPPGWPDLVATVPADGDPPRGDQLARRARASAPACGVPAPRRDGGVPLLPRSVQLLLSCGVERRGRRRSRAGVERGQRVAQPPVYILVHLDVSVRGEVVGVAEPLQRGVHLGVAGGGACDAQRARARRVSVAGRSTAGRAAAPPGAGSVRRGRLRLRAARPGRLRCPRRYLGMSRSCPDATRTRWGTVDHDGHDRGVPRRTREALRQPASAEGDVRSAAAPRPFGQLPHHGPGRHLRRPPGRRPDRGARHRPGPAAARRPRSGWPWPATTWWRWSTAS